jgi:type I site-specific restriction-modification system R (restriction) subunit
LCVFIIKLEALIGSENRIKNIAQDIVSHFEQRQKVLDGKGMIVAMSRRIAADLYAEIRNNLRKQNHGTTEKPLPAFPASRNHHSSSD